MANLSGAEIVAAIKKSSTWGTAVACGANDGVLILPSSLTRNASIDVDDSLGTFFSSDGTPGPVTVEGQLPGYLRYDGMMNTLLAYVLGTAPAPSAIVSPVSGYTHNISWAKKLEGLFVTISKNMVNYVEEYPSAKITGFTIKGEVGKPLTVDYDVIACSKIPDSTVNTLTTMNNVTYFETSNRIRFSEGVFRINTASGAALAAGDTIYPSSFELSVKRKLIGFHTGQYTEVTGSAKQEWVNEPSNDGPPEVTLKMSFPRHTSSTRILELSNDTRKKMDITFLGATISGGTTARQLKIELPHLQMKSLNITDKQGAIDEPVEFIVHAATTAPTGMAVTDPCKITVVNRRSTSMLA